MKWFFAFLLMLSQSSFASGPSRNVAYSCLIGSAFNTSIALEEIPSNAVSSDDDFKSGYKATYLVTFKGVRLGYAERNGRDALIYGAQIFSLDTALNLLQAEVFKPIGFKPDLADWSRVREKAKQYMCVSFNFDGLGRSGSFQNVHGAYLLSIGSPRKLYYLMGDIRALPLAH